MLVLFWSKLKQRKQSEVVVKLQSGLILKLVFVILPEIICQSLIFPVTNELERTRWYCSCVHCIYIHPQEQIMYGYIPAFELSPYMMSEDNCCCLRISEKLGVDLVVLIDEVFCCNVIFIDSWSKSLLWCIVRFTVKQISKLTSLHPSRHWSVPSEQQDEGSVPFKTSYQSVLLVTPQHLNWKRRQCKIKSRKLAQM